MCCIVNDYRHKTKYDGSADAVDKFNRKVQVKATSNFNRDVSSFGPESEFEILEFVRLDYQNDIFYLYRIDIDILNNIKVNKHETFKEQQTQKRRPRFSIIKQIINEHGIKYYAYVNMKKEK